MSTASTTSTPPRVMATPSFGSAHGWRLTAKTSSSPPRPVSALATDAYNEIQRSLERLRTDHVDLIQLHNLVDEDEWRTAFARGGALEAVVEAKDEGLVRHMGVTGHGVTVAAQHLRSLQEYPFASVLLPYNFPMSRNAALHRRF